MSREQTHPRQQQTNQQQSNSQQANQQQAKSQHSLDPRLEDKLNELYHLTNDIEEKTKKKNQVRNELIPLIKANRLEGRKFAIGNRCIKYKMENQTEGLTQKLLLKSLQDYYGPQRADDAMKVYKYILSKREQKSRETISVDKRITKSN